MHAAFARPLEVDGVALAVEIVVGIAIAPDNGPDDREMIRRAEIAMSTARSQGARTLQYEAAQDEALRDTPTRA